MSALIIGDDMAFEQPLYDRETVNAAVRQLLEHGPAASGQTREIVENWRNSHFFPHNRFIGTLRQKAAKVYSRAVVSERRKRLKSILKKLRDEPNMRFTQMQDIAGCRAVVGSIRTVYALDKAYQRSWLKHEFKSRKDYIAEPKGTGYRSVHLVYAYHSKRSPAYNGLKVELQFRSPLQHAWATAVETVGTFRGENLKSGQGDSDWLRFFALMSSHLAKQEKTEPVPGTPSNLKVLRDEIRELATSLDAIQQLQAFTEGLNVTTNFQKQADYYVLELDVQQRTLNIKSHLKIAAATRDALEVETSRVDSDTVLVSVSDLNALRRAYPNYFADTRVFLQHVSTATGLLIP